MSAVNISAVVKQTERQYTVESRSQPGLLHVVRKTRAGLQCDCEAAVNGMPCWHVASVALVASADLKWERAKRIVISEETRTAALNMLMGRQEATMATLYTVHRPCGCFDEEDGG